MLGGKAETGFRCGMQKSVPGTSLNEILVIQQLVDKLVTLDGKVIYDDNEPINLLCPRDGVASETKREGLRRPAEAGSGYNEIAVHHAPKIKRRGAWVQYSTVDDPLVVKFNGEVSARRARYQSLLSGGSKRFLISGEPLGSLGVPAGILVPAGARGGGACAYNKELRVVHTLPWRTTLQHPHTLCHSFQEVTPVASLAGLPAATQRRVSAAAAYYDVIFEPPS